MTDYYDSAVCTETLPCSIERFNLLAELIGEEIEADDGEMIRHGFTLEYEDGEIVLLHDDEGSVTAENLPLAFRQELGRLLAELNKPHWEIGVAQHASRTVIGGYGGYCFRIDQAGDLWMQDYTFHKLGADNQEAV